MRSDDLTPEQCRALADKFGAMQADLGRVLKRMQVREFPTNDPLQLPTQKAFGTMQELTTHVHYLGCGQITTQPTVEPPTFAKTELPRLPSD
jgi:hypothetical protein